MLHVAVAGDMLCVIGLFVMLSLQSQSGGWWRRLDF